MKAVGTCKFLHKLEISEFHDKPALVGIEKLSISARLIGVAGVPAALRRDELVGQVTQPPA